jgi:ribosomal protein S18 acetylase RimI-like enzyme
MHSSARRRGIGRALMQALETRARAMGRSLITLDTAAGGTAPALYRALGYQEFGALPGYALTPDGQPSAVIFFAKTL